MIDLSKLDPAHLDLSFLPPSLLGRLAFSHSEPNYPQLPPGYTALDLADERDTILFVPQGLKPGTTVPLLVMFHGANGNAEQLKPFLQQHAEKRQFLLLLPQSTYHTWDLAIGGNGPDLDRLERALNKLSSHFRLTPDRICLAGFSDGASYALSIGVSNGDLISHAIMMSGGFMNAYKLIGKPQVFIAHSPEDEQLPIDKCGKKLANQLKQSGYDVDYLEFSGNHAIHPHVVEKAVDFFVGKHQP